MFRETSVCIVGLGLMGGSLALGLKGQVAQLLALEPDPSTRELARSQKVVDLVSADPGAVLPQADIVVLAMPVRQILAFISHLPELHPGSPVLLDLGSTKSSISAALEELPDRFQVVPAHPICGKETSGLVHADAELFREAPFVLVPLDRTGAAARETAERLVRAVGAEPVWLPADVHDARVARTSHLPYLLAVALAASVEGAHISLAGPGYRSATRLAGTSPQIGLDMLVTNKAHVSAALEAFREELADLEKRLSEGDIDALGAKLGEAREIYLMSKIDNRRSRNGDI